MGNLREAIKDVIVRNRIVRIGSYSSQIGKLASVMPFGAEGDLKPGKNYDEIAREVSKIIEASGELTTSQLRDAAWCLWETEPALTETAKHLKQYLASVKGSPRASAKRSLAMSYMVNFGSERDGIEAVGAALKEMGTTIGEPYNQLQKAFNIFDPNRGPKNLGRSSVIQKQSPSSILQGLGMSALGHNSSFAAVAGIAALNEMAADKSLSPTPRLQLAKSIALKTETELSLETAGPSFANALCMPYESGGLNDEEQDLFVEVLVGVFKDPRTHPGNWVRMPDAKAVVERWQTRQALRQFFDVVDDVALQRMWMYRRAFWEAVYDAGLIRSAWVVFDQHGSSIAQRRFGRNVKFGRFDSSSGIQSGHTVLIMRIGRGTVAEWSHNGRCHIWNDSDTGGAPIMFKGRYSPDELRAGYRRNPDFSQTHSSPETYSWQRKVADKIHNMTGARINGRDYRI